MSIKNTKRNAGSIYYIKYVTCARVYSKTLSNQDLTKKIDLLIEKKCVYDTIYKVHHKYRSVLQNLINLLF